MNADLAKRLRAACGNVRRQSMPLIALVPLMQEAADAIDAQSPSQPLVEVQEPEACLSQIADIAQQSGLYPEFEKQAVRGLPLTEGQIENLAKECLWLGFRKDANDEYTIPVISGSVMKLIRKVEAAHGIGASSPSGSGEEKS